MNHITKLVGEYINWQDTRIYVCIDVFIGRQIGMVSIINERLANWTAL